MDQKEGISGPVLSLKPVAFDEVLEGALQAKPMTPEEKKVLEEEYRNRERKAPGRKKGSEAQS